MSLLCSLTGQPAANPVLNPKNGRVYDKHMIEQHLLTASSDPISGDPLSTADLIAISPASLALPPFVSSSASSASSSLSSLLSQLQREYDGVMLEQFQLKREVYTLKQELAHSLYQYDAACRVIARLVLDKDELRQAITHAQHTQPQHKTDGRQQAASEAMEVEGERKEAAATMAVGERDAEAKDVSERMKAAFEETSERLGGKKRKAWLKERQAAGRGKDAMAAYTLQSSYTLHGASITGVNALDVDERDGQRLLLSGGADGTVCVMDAKAGKVRETLKGHKKRVTGVAFVPVAPSIAMSDSTSSAHLPILSSSADHSVHLYRYESTREHYELAADFSPHSEAITGLSVHPSHLYFATASTGSSYRIYSTAATSLAPLLSTATPSPVSSIRFHPDGRIVGLTCADGGVRMYDALQSLLMASFTTEHQSPTTTLAFSPNGYQCASGDDSGVVKLWDLRHVSGDKPANYATIRPAQQQKVAALAYDDSAAVLVVGGGSEVSVWECKGWSEVVAVEGSQGRGASGAGGCRRSVDWQCQQGPHCQALESTAVRDWRGGVTTASIVCSCVDRQSIVTVLVCSDVIPVQCNNTIAMTVVNGDATMTTHSAREGKR